MYEFLLWLASLFAPTLPPPPPAPPVKAQDCVGLVAAEAAYSAAIPSKEVEKERVWQDECETCNKTGMVRSGDDQGWSKCPDCKPRPGTGKTR
jgi:cytochrome c5